MVQLSVLQSIITGDGVGVGTANTTASSAGVATDGVRQCSGRSSEHVLYIASELCNAVTAARSVCLLNHQLPTLLQQ
jgi:hypothetical protein